MPFAMSQTEREAFLAVPRIAVLSLNDGARGPLAAPVWYDYAVGGELWFLTQTTSRKAKLLDVGTRLSLTVQREQAPYAYVSVEGPVTAIAPYELETDLLAMAARYLGPDGGRGYLDNVRATWKAETSVKISVRPERWLSVDYAKRG